MNLAATLARSGRRVLLVDSDPQCNLTSYLIEDEVVDELLDKADSPNGQTIWSGVQPVAEALGGFKAVRPLETGIKNLFLIPGDIRLSEFETDLAEFWAQCLQRKPKGFRGTTAISELVGYIVDRLKIDRQFVAELDRSANAGVIIQAIVALGRALGMTVLIEGVETEEQRVLLRLAGCNEMQGFLFARPAPREEIDRLLASAEAAGTASRSQRTGT